MAHTSSAHAQQATPTTKQRGNFHGLLKRTYPEAQNLMSHAVEMIAKGDSLGLTDYSGSI